MSIVSELIISIVGGVLTAAVLALFSRGGRARTRSDVAIGQGKSRRRGSFFGDLFRLVFAVSGGIAIALLGGRVLIQSGLLPPGLGTRLGLLLAGTVFCWIVVASGRR
jgi:hypothetical protein